MSLATAEADGSASATLDGQIFGAGSVSVRSLGANHATADATALGVSGATSADGAIALADSSPTLVARVGDGTTPAGVHASGAVAVSSESDSDATATGHTLAVGGLFSLGSDVSVATVSPAVTATVGKGSLIVTSGGSIYVHAVHDSGATGATATATAPGGGFIAANGAVPKAVASAIVAAGVGEGATLYAGGDIAIRADATNIANATATALTVGLLAAVGTSVAIADASGQTSATLDGVVSNANNLAVAADGRNFATTNADATGGALFGGNGAISLATVDPVNTARIGDDAVASKVRVLNDVSLRAGSLASATGHGIAKTGAALLGIGVVVSTAKSTPRTAASVGAFSDIEAMRGSIIIGADHNVDGAIGALATAESPGLSGAVAANGAVPTATSHADTSIFVAHRSKLAAGRDVVIDAESIGKASANAIALSGAFGAAFGVSIPTATSDGRTTTVMDGTIIKARDVSILAGSTDAAIADGQSASVGIGLAASGVVATASVAPTTVAQIGDKTASGSVAADGHVTLASVEVATSKARAYSGSAGLLGFGLASAKATTSPVVGAVLDKGSSIGTAGAVTIAASLDSPAVGDTAEASAQSPGAGVVSGNGAIADAEAKPTVFALADLLSNLTAGLGIDVDAASAVVTAASTDATSYGLAALGVATAYAESSGSTTADVLGKAVEGATIVVAADGAHVASATAQATTGGFSLSGAGSIAKAIVAPTTATTLGASDRSTKVTSVGNIGVDAHETDCADASGGSFSIGLIAAGLVDAGAHVTPTVVTAIGAGTILTSGTGDVAITATFNGGPVGTIATAHGTSISAGLSAISTAAVAEVAPIVGVKAAPGVQIGTRGAVTIAADSKEAATATTDELAGSLLLAVGGASDVATLGGSTEADADGFALLFASGGVEVSAHDVGRAKSHANAFGGGLLVGASGSAAISTTDRTVGARLGGVVISGMGVGIDAVADDKATAVADGVTVGGAGAVGTSAATATTKDHATVDDDSVITASGFLFINAIGMNDGDATANTSAGGAVGIDGSRATVVGSIDDLAHIGAGSHVNALGIGVVADSVNLGFGLPNGQAGGLVGAGSQATHVGLDSTTIADVGDATAADPTDLTGTFFVTITAHGRDDGAATTLGGNGGLLGAGGGATSTFIVHAPTTTAAIGEDAHVVTSGSLTMLASDIVTPVADADQHGAGGLSTQEAIARAAVIDEALLVEIRENATVQADTVFARAQQEDVTVVASAKTDVPIAAAGFGHAYSYVDAYTSSIVHVAAGVAIVAADTVTLDASGPNHTFTSSKAEADVVGIPIPVAVAVASSEKHSDDCVIVGPTATIAAATLDITFGANPPIGPDDGYSKTTHTNVDGIKSDGVTGPGIPDERGLPPPRRRDGLPFALGPQPHRRHTRPDRRRDRADRDRRRRPEDHGRQHRRAVHRRDDPERDLGRTPPAPRPRRRRHRPFGDPLQPAWRCAARQRRPVRDYDQRNRHVRRHADGDRRRRGRGPVRLVVHDGCRRHADELDDLQPVDRRRPDRRADRRAGRRRGRHDVRREPGECRPSRPRGDRADDPRPVA